MGPDMMTQPYISRILTTRITENWNDRQPQRFENDCVDSTR